MSDFLLIALVSGVCAAIVSLAVFWTLGTRISRLEFELAVLQERLLSEIKRRARSVAQKNQDFDAEVLAAAKTQPQPTVQPFWWERFPVIAKGAKS